ncbi:alpha/beta hydrolase family protein [Parapedobacter koreensis]|uniref:Dipeptidyl aminopeptidase/acylaminoacyl peptidase n=1 Tax=Parapedobacter koreensis TaxID=332977 RepID=A0A1H7PXH0_9SPHI|nr:prolyl oligopeptidase family serine peptidase [Parapedobacter koreensis]SEL40094.1 Dipeptidyl aminopeptidase/acylaminoacyl peptidase [Parapedobacter koreensis]
MEMQRDFIRIYTLKMRRSGASCLWLLLLSLAQGAFAQQNLKYQLPPQSIVDLVDAPRPAAYLFSTDGHWLMILHPPGYESIEQVAQPILGIAGLRINPITNTWVAEVADTYQSATVRDLTTGEEFSLAGLPEGVQIADVKWSPKGNGIAFLNKSLHDTELWVADFGQRSARKMLSGVNDTYGESFQWAKGGDALLVRQVIQQRGPVPPAPAVPEGPVVQENLGGIAPARTYQNLLANAYDEELMEYYLSAQLVEVGLDGTTRNIGDPGIFERVSFSPNGKYLLVEKVVRPYSYVVPISSFPTAVSIWSADGTPVKALYTTPLADNLPPSFDAVIAGPRNFAWQKNVDATVTWLEAPDQGNPDQEAAFRDELFAVGEPFDMGAKKKIYAANYRIRSVYWGEDWAIVSENWRKDRSTKLTLIDPASAKVVKTLSTRKSEDTYTDPGDFIIGSKGLLLADKTGSVFTKGLGASPEGDRPFVLKWKLDDGKVDTLFKSQRGYYEEPAFFNNDDVVYFTRESSTASPNLFAVTLKGKKESQLTNFPDPYPSLKSVQKQLLSYPRKDGLTLSATLYLPADFKKGDAPLPVLIWAYPREFKTKEAAGQVKGSAHRYPVLAFRSPVYWVTRGYAVLDQADMPIVGEGDNEPNDTFIQQIEDNARALIDYVVDMGVADRNRIAVGGHSYGAFMTANLLAHTDLFAAGIARSGAYNRTLTPFGFQGEARTYWQAKDVYDAMSPFTYASQIKAPLLMTHGMDDENSGTFPIQSERLYAAIKGHGGVVRLVLLPKEFHGYRSREGVLHTFWEQDQWLENYVKNKEK